MRLDNVLLVVRILSQNCYFPQKKLVLNAKINQGVSAVSRPQEHALSLLINAGLASSLLATTAMAGNNQAPNAQATFSQYHISIE